MFNRALIIGVVVFTVAISLLSRNNTDFVSLAVYDSQFSLLIIRNGLKIQIDR